MIFKSKLVVDDHLNIHGYNQLMVDFGHCVLFIDIFSVYEIENGNGECAKETTTRPKSRQQQKVTNRSSIQRQILAPGGVLQLAPKQTYTGSVIMNIILNSKLYTRN